MLIIVILYFIDRAFKGCDVLVGLFLWAFAVSEHVSHVKNQSVISYQIQ